MKITNNIIPGLCSISFRQLEAEDIISLCRELGIPAIEWGGDIHAPHGDAARGKQLSRLCRDAGISCPSYGSYYRVGISEAQGLPFSDVLSSARALGAETVRVWGGIKNYTEYSPSELDAAVRDLRRIADLASAEGLTVSLEYHENSLTHTPEAVEALDKAVSRQSVRYYWQPPHVLNDQACLNSLVDLGERLTNIHVFQWRLTEFREQDKRIERLPLEVGIPRWRRFLAALEGNRTHYAFLEFVKGDDPQQLRRDWESFCKILEKK
ncbi:MAG: TIM barrel protein [Spirochaetales bacterium]|nr:TIM barrel protein [Spirochaetales bacterium]